MKKLFFSFFGEIKIQTSLFLKCDCFGYWQILQLIHFYPFLARRLL